MYSMDSVIQDIDKDMVSDGLRGAAQRSQYAYHKTCI